MFTAIKSIVLDGWVGGWVGVKAFFYCSQQLKSIVLDGWVGGCKSRFKDCLQQSTNCNSKIWWHLSYLFSCERIFAYYLKGISELSKQWFQNLWTVHLKFNLENYWGRAITKEAKINFTIEWKSMQNISVLF